MRRPGAGADQVSDESDNWPANETARQRTDHLEPLSAPIDLKSQCGGHYVDQLFYTTLSWLLQNHVVIG